MNTANYPTKYKNLLIEAGLIGTGERIVKTLVAGNRRTTLDEQSDTWVESEEFETDFRGSAEYFAPVILAGGIIAGDWRHGLDAEQIRKINQECGVQVYDANTMIYIYDGKRFDLGNPSHMAEFRIIERGNVIAGNRNTLQAGQRFYFVSTEEVEKEKRKVREQKVEAITLSNTLDVEEKRMVLEMANWRYKLGHSGSMSDQQVRDVFADLALGDHYARVVEIYNMPGKRFYSLMYACFDHGILVSQGDRGAVSYPGSKEPLANDHDTFVSLMMRDNSLFGNLQQRLDNVLNANRYDQVILPEKVELVHNYDTTIHEEGDVGFWGMKACKQYVKEKGWIPSISDADGVEKWRKLVLDIYHGRASGYGNAPVQGGIPAGIGMQMADFDREGTKGSEFILTTTNVNNMSRDLCKAFMDKHKDLAERKLFEVSLSGNSSTEKWRETVKDFLSLLNATELEEVFLETV
jgi:hypothetical protein